MDMMMDIWQTAYSSKSEGTANRAARVGRMIGPQGTTSIERPHKNQTAHEVTRDVTA